MLHRSQPEVHADAMPTRRLPETLSLAACGLALLLLGAMLFKHLSYPLLWEEEAATAGFGARILTYGYPKVHGPKSALYPSALSAELGIEPSLDAYRGSPWGPYYLAAFAESIARTAQDPWVRTGRLRAPFALAGVAAAEVAVAARRVTGGMVEYRDRFELNTKS